MLNLRRSFGILFITLVFSSLHAQQALPPAQHGGNLNRTIDLRSPDAGTIQKKVEYSFDKQNPRHRSLAPTTRSCHTLEVEQQQQAFSPGSTQSDTLFESWMQSSLRQAQQSRSLFRFGPEEVLTIPTVVHVIYSSAIENISDAQVYSQINSLNLDYRRQNPDQEFTPRDFKNLAVDTGIEFCLASLDPQGRPSNGIHRVSFSGAPFNERYLNEVIKPATAWDPNRYFNIWVCALSDNVLGFATFPVSSGLTGVPMQRTSALTDGVVIHYSVFGTTGTVSPPFNKGRTATHEVGHWLGLRHVWGDGPCNVDDFCADTPEADGPHFNCPQGALGCRGSNAMVQNYMDYSDDACMNLFTRDQKARMRLVLQNSPRRGSLLQSGVCIPPVTPPVPAFSANVRQGCAPLEVAFKDLTKGEELSWQWNFPGGRPATSDKQHPVVSYRDPGVYPVSLRAINPAGNRSVTMEGFITVTASGQGLPYFADFEPNEATRSSNYFLNNADNDYTWAISERLGARGRSAQSLAINNYDNKLLNSADWFLLPVLNFSGEPSPELSFDLAYGPFNEKFSDTLGIFVSTGCGTLFRSIYYKGGSKLSTLNGQQSLEPFSPDNQEWRTERIDLRFLAGQTNVQIAFINFNGNGNDVYLDNIRLGSPLPPAPVANFAATNQQVCAGEPITLGDRSSGTTTEGIWSFPGGTPASSQEKNPTVKYEFPGSYDVIYTVRGPGGENSLTKKGFITVAQAPNLQVTGEYEICQGETMNLKASGADQYTWMIGSQTLKTGNSPDFSFAPQKDEVLTVVAKGGQCETRRAIPIRVRAVRPLAVTPASTEICPGEQVSLQATGAMQYIWSPAPPESEAQSGTLTVSPSVTTTYQVNGVNESGCQLTAKVTVTVREAPNALGVTAPRTRICPGDQITLAASGADSYRWSPTTGLSLSDGAQVVASPTTTTTYRLEGTNAFGCRSSRNITIEVTPYPEVQIRSLSPTVCSGAGVTLQARGALRYEWFPSELVSGQGSEAIGRPTQDQVFTVIGKTEAGCADTAQVFVSVIQPEPLTVTATNEVVCPGANTQLLATGAVSYQWNLGTATSTSDRVVVRPFREETYQVIGLDRQGCQSTRSITIKVSEGRSAVADFRADKQITCAGQSVTFSSLSRDATSFRWEFEGGQPAFSTEANPSVVFPSEGSFSVRLEVAGCDGRRDRFEQTDYMYITAPSQISLNTADRVACRGEQVSLVASGGRSYTWSPAIGLDRTSGASVLAMPLATTTYTVSSIDADGCSASRSVTLEVVSAQDVTVSPAKASICVGDSVNLQATGALEYFWTPGTTVSNGRSATFKAKPARTTTYVMEARDLNGCQYRKEVLVEVSPAISMKLTADRMKICSGESVALNADGATVVQWSPAAFLSSPTGRELQAFPTETTRFLAIGTNEVGCRAEASLTIEVESTVPVSVVAQDDVICPGQGTLLTASGGVSYSWSPSMGLNQTSGAIVTAAPSETTTYTVSRDGATCGAAAQITIEVKAPEPLMVSPTTAQICLGDKVTLSVSGGTRYVWELAEGLNTVAGAEVEVKPSATTQYVVNSLDSRGCELTGTATVIVAPGNFVTASTSASTVCAGEEITLTAEGGVSYSWRKDPTLLSDTGARVYAQPTIGTTYLVTGTNEQGCEAIAAVEVFVREFEADFSMIPGSIDLAEGPGLVQFQGELEGAVEYAWSFGGQGSSEEPNPLHVFALPGTYPIGFAASDGICVSRMRQELIVENSSSLEALEDEGQILITSLGGGKFQLAFVSPRNMYLPISILDATGTELLSGALRPAKERFIQVFDLRAYPDGNYFLRISDGEMTKTLSMRK